MKKIIDGKLYNTETADLVGEWSNGYFKNDFNYCSQDLYRTKKGAWFIHGEGGALSEYHKAYGNNRTGGENINVLTDDEALLWCEEHLDVDEYEAFFSNMVEEA